MNKKKNIIILLSIIVTFLSAYAYYTHQKAANYGSYNPEAIRAIAQKINHIAIIPDGNRRWAKGKGLTSYEGHKEAVRIIPALFESIWELGIHTATLPVFSTENWKRSSAEVNNLMILFVKLLNDMLPIAHKFEVKIIHLGRKDRIPATLLQAIKSAEKETQHFSKHIFNIGIDYNGPDEIVRTCQKIISQNRQDGKLTLEDFAKNLDTGLQPYPNPDLVIRTSGEQRISGFMSWQLSYSELYFTLTHFPDFNKPQLYEALWEFDKRQRRFGE